MKADCHWEGMLLAAELQHQSSIIKLSPALGHFQNEMWPHPGDKLLDTFQHVAPVARA